MEFVSGLLYEYYFICRRKVWYLANGISMENENENVQIGRLIDENSYGREKKHILIDESANIDFFRDKTVYEIKKSSSQKQAAIGQLKYYLYVLKQKGVETEGELRIPKENKVERVVLSEGDEQEIKQNIAAIEKLMHSEEIPPMPTRQTICKKCAFYEMCCI